MESVRAARARLARYPAQLALCSSEAGAYARCVTAAMAEVRRDECAKEFLALQECVRRQAQAKKLK